MREATPQTTKELTRRRERHRRWSAIGAYVTRRVRHTRAQWRADEENSHETEFRCRARVLLALALQRNVRYALRQQNTKRRRQGHTAITPCGCSCWKKPPTKTSESPKVL